MRVAFVYPNPRADLLPAIADGSAPDTALLGQNHLAAHGIQADVHDSALRRRRVRGGLLHRATWYLREIALPVELGSYDVMCTPLATLAPLMSRIRRRPQVVLFNYGLSTVYERSSRLRRPLIRAAVHAAGAIIFLGESQRRRLAGQFALDAKRTFVLPLGVDAEFHRATPLPADGYVLAVGRDLARDYRTLADAARRWERKTVIVTEERNLVGVNLPPNVDVRRGLTYEELRCLYEGARCVVLPLRHEGYRFGTDGGGLTALLESMASARPVVASDRAIMRDYVGAETGILVRPEDPQALGEAVTALLEDDERSLRLGAAARRRVEDRHTTRRFAAGLAEILGGLPSAS